MILRSPRLRHRFLVAAAFVTSFCAAVAYAAGPTGDSLAKVMPQGALAYGELAGLGQLIQRIENSAYLKIALESPQFVAFKKTPQWERFEAGRRVVEDQLDADLIASVKGLLGNRIAVAVYPKEGSQQPDAVLAIRVSDAKALERIRRKVENLLTLTAGDKIDRKDSVGDVAVVGIDNKVFYAGKGDWLIVSSQRELVKKAVQQSVDGNGQSLLNDATAGPVLKRLGDGHLFVGYADIRMATQRDGKRLAPQKLDNPLVSLLAGGIYELAVKSPSIGVVADLKDDRFSITASVTGDYRKLGESYTGFFSAPSAPGADPVPPVKGVLGGFTFHRNLASLYKAREELLQEQALPGFDKFETGLANILPNRDFGNDVLPLMGNNLTIVIARQDYKELGGEPGMKLPGLAIVAEMAKPEEGANLFQMFFQTITALSNIAVGQQGGVPMVMAAEQYKDVIMQVGKRLQKPSGKDLPVIYNYTPASALVGKKFIMSSSVELCRSLVDYYSNPASKESGGEVRNLLLAAYPEEIAQILEENKNVLTSRMVQGGKALEQAEKEFATILSVVKQFREASIATLLRSEAIDLRVEVTW